MSYKHETPHPRLSQEQDRRRKPTGEWGRLKLANKICYFHPENDLDFLESLERRREQRRAEELSALNDIFHL